MNPQTKRLLTLGGLLFAFGAVVGIALATVSVWADLEANFYGFDKMTDRQYTGLRCPVLMSSTEEGVVTATFTNPAETPIEPLIRADFSSRLMLGEEREHLRMEPGETKSISWTVTSENVDLRNFIFVKVFQYPASVLSPHEGVCGIVVLDFLGLKGNQTLILGISASIIGMLAGLFLLERVSWQHRGQLPDFRRLRFFLVLVVLALVTGLSGRWLIGGFLLAAVILATIAILGSLLLHER